MLFFKNSLLFACLLSALALRAQTFTAEQVRADLDFLQRALYEGHPGTFVYNTRDSLDLFFDQLRSQIPPQNVTTDHVQLMTRLAVARVRDGHTSVLTPFFDDSTEVMPLLVRAQGERVFVLRNYSGDTSLHRGAELLQINGIPVSDVVRLCRLLPSADGYHLSHRDIMSSVYFARYFRLLFGPQKVFALTALQPSGQRSTHRLAAKTRAAILQLQQVKTSGVPSGRHVYKLRQQILYRDTLHPDMAILKMTNFEARGYGRFYKKTFRLLRRENFHTLVLDFRFNTGGNVFNMGMLCGQILDSTIRYHYERPGKTRPARFFGLKGKLYIGLAWLKYNLSPGLRHDKREGRRVSERRIRQRRKNNFDGRVFILTDGFSFSAASMCASFLKNHGHATVIGTETGGAETGNCGGGFPALRLPNTRMRIRFPVYYLDYQVGKPKLGQGVQPDYPTPYAIDDLLQGRDLEMEKVYELLKNSPKKF